MESGQKDLMKSFVSESELAEVKKKRQDEWEKNRKPGQPLGFMAHSLEYVLLLNKWSKII